MPRLAAAQRRLVRRPAGGEAVREVGAAELRPGRALRRRRLDAVQITPARITAACGDPLGHLHEPRVRTCGRGHWRCTTTAAACRARTEGRRWSGGPAPRAGAAG